MMNTSEKNAQSGQQLEELARRAEAERAEWLRLMQRRMKIDARIKELDRSPVRLELFDAVDALRQEHGLPAMNPSQDYDDGYAELLHHLQQQAAQREAAQREAAQREAAQREAAREAARREAARHEAEEREAEEREAARVADGKTPKSSWLKRHLAQRIC